jgi:putative tricarboxylic transport membrane protein
MTCLDGYQMTLQGRAGVALGISAISSFIAGSLSIVGLMFFAPVVADLALSFGPVENFALMFLGFTVVISLAGKSLLKGVLSCSLGLILASIGLDEVQGSPRLSFGTAALLNGVDFIAVVVGMFAIPEVLEGIEQSATGTLIRTTLRGLFPTWQDWKASCWPILRGTALGFGVGLVPGGSGTVATFLTYDLEKKLSKHPERFGKGAIEGVAGPEAANNAAASSSFIPLLTLGIPGNASTAMIFAALLIQGVTPGPFLLKEHPNVFWGVVASMYLGNVMLLVLNLPLVGMWAQLLRVPYAFMAPMIMVLTLVGVYSVNNSVFDIWVMLVMGIFGYMARKLKFDLGPLLLAFVLGPIMERSLRQALLMSHGSFGIFFTRPISGVLLGVAVLFVLGNLVAAYRAKRTTPAAA